MSGAGRDTEMIVVFTRLFIATLWQCTQLEAIEISIKRVFKWTGYMGMWNSLQSSKGCWRWCHMSWLGKMLDVYMKYKQVIREQCVTWSICKVEWPRTGEKPDSRAAWTQWPLLSAACLQGGDWIHGCPKPRGQVAVELEGNHQAPPFCYLLEMKSLCYTLWPVKVAKGKIRDILASSNLQVIINV